MLKKQKILAKGIEIVTFNQNKTDYLSMTDIAKYKNRETTGLVISHWLSTRYTVEFMGVWEQLHNKDFNVTEFSNIRNNAGSNGFVLSSKQWITKTNAVGIISKSGRYGGTYAHKDIAFEFATWISPEFKLYLIKEFQRLKEEESLRLSQGWDIKRMLAKINYRIHTDAVQAHLIPANIPKNKVNLVYANEADVLNVALFGKTAKEWRTDNKNKDGNIRDYADVTQLVVLSNLEGINAELIRQGLSQPDRLQQLNQIAITQMKSLLGSNSVNKLKAKV